MPFNTILNTLNINICIATLFYRKSMLHFRIQYIYIGIRHVCSSVCVSIYSCMCVCSGLWSPHFLPILLKLGPHSLNTNLKWLFSQILKFLIWWRHNGFFKCFAMWHSHGRSFALILFKITDKVQLSLPMFGIENQLNRLITSGRKSASRSKKSLPWFRARLRGHGFESRRGQNFAFCFCYY